MLYRRLFLYNVLLKKDSKAFSKKIVYRFSLKEKTLIQISFQRKKLLYNSLEKNISICFYKKIKNLVKTDFPLKKKLLYRFPLKKKLLFTFFKEKTFIHIFFKEKTLIQFSVEEYIYKRKILKYSKKLLYRFSFEVKLLYIPFKRIF